MEKYYEWVIGDTYYIYYDDGRPNVEEEYNGYDDYSLDFLELEEEYVENEYRELYFEKYKDEYLEDNLYGEELDDESTEIEREEETEITTNDVKQIIDLSRCLSKKQINYLKQHAMNMKIGNLGELYVYEYERNKLKGTFYYNKVDKTKADVPMNGYDILSYTRGGTPIHIEVKTTTQKESSEFYITDRELETAKYMNSQGMIYILYLVKDIESDNPILEIIDDILDEQKIIYTPTQFKGQIKRGV